MQGTTSPSGSPWREKRRSSPSQGWSSHEVDRKLRAAVEQLTTRSDTSSQSPIPSLKLSQLEKVEDLRPVWADSRLLHIAGRLCYDTGRGLDVHMWEFLSAVVLFDGNPTREKAEEIDQNFLAIADETQSGKKICRRGLYHFSDDTRFLEAVNKSREELEWEGLYDPIVQLVINKLDDRYFNFDYPECYLPKHAASFFRGVETSEMSSLAVIRGLAGGPLDGALKTALESELPPAPGSLSPRKLRLPRQGNELKLSAKTEEAIFDLAAQLVVPAADWTEEYVDKKAQRVAFEARRCFPDVVASIQKVDVLREALHNFQKQKNMTTEAALELERVLLELRFKLAFRLPFLPSEELLEVAKTEVEVRLEAARLPGLELARNVMPDEKEQLLRISSENSWRHIASDDEVILPNKLRVNKESLTKDSIVAFLEDLAKALGESTLCSDKAERLMSATSISARNICELELRDKCEELFQTPDINLRKDAQATRLELCINPQTGWTSAVRTEWHETRWIFDETKAETSLIARFCLRFEFKLNDELNSQQLSIRIQEFSFGDSSVPSNKRKIVVQALKKIGAAGKVYSNALHGRRSINLKRHSNAVSGKRANE